MATEDIKLNDFGEVTSIAKLLGLDSSGNGKYITQKNLLADAFQEMGNVTSNLDNYTTSGIYGVNDGIFDTGLIKYGMLIVFSGLTKAAANGGYPIIQILFNGSYPAVVMKMRIRWINKWSDWKAITLT